MADTLRTKSAVLSLLADNNVGAISPQDIRDTVISLLNDHGQLYQAGTPAATTISTQDTWTLANIVTPTLLGGPERFDNPSGHRLRYTGGETRRFNVMVFGALSLTTPAHDLSVGIARNGSIQTQANNKLSVVTGINFAAFCLGGQIALGSNDYVELYLQNNTNTDNITVEQMSMFAQGMLV